MPASGRHSWRIYTFPRRRGIISQLFVAAISRLHHIKMGSSSTLGPNRHFLKIFRDAIAADVAACTACPCVHNNTFRTEGEWQLSRYSFNSTSLDFTKHYCILFTAMARRFCLCRPEEGCSQQRLLECCSSCDH